jgi:sirohydrochlorin ferrochelatase
MNFYDIAVMTMNGSYPQGAGSGATEPPATAVRMDESRLSASRGPKAPPGRPLEPPLAVLVIAHGSPHPEWNETVETAVRQAGLALPVRVGFLGGVPGRGIADELARFEQDGFRTVIVVPLFISEGSTHLTEIRYMLGLIPEPDIETDLRPVRTAAKLVWCPPLEDAPQAEAVWTDRVRELSAHAEQETLLVIGHGSGHPRYRERWARLLQKAASRLQRKFGFRQASYATLLPDTAAAEAAKLAGEGRLLVLPLFLSEGYFTQKAIPGRLNGLSYIYSGKTYLPHPLVSEWIGKTVSRQLARNFQNV